MIYFDNNATTPLDPRVLASMEPYLSQNYGNPSSLYRAGRFARTAIERAREQVAELVGAHVSEVIFTSGGTEANNMAIKGFGYSHSPASIAISTIEHPSVTSPANRLQEQGWKVTEITVDHAGRVNVSLLRSILQQQPGFVSIMFANNENGVIQDMASITDICLSQGAIVHTDAVQALGKIPVNFQQLGVQLMTLSSHKIYGPKGCGALIRNKSLDLTPLQEGGGQESELRGGTENVAAIVGFGTAAEIAGTELEQRSKHTAMLKSNLERALSDFQQVSIFSQDANRLANTSQFGIRGVDGEMLLMMLDQKGIAVSSGSACASGKSEPSPVLTAMKIEPELANSAIRVSFGQQNSQTEIDTFVETLASLIPN